jgi:hypothetical protein
MPFHRPLTRNIAACLLAAFLAYDPGFFPAYAADAIILNTDRYRVDTGRYSSFASFQRNLQRTLDDCGQGTPHVVAPGEEPLGRIGSETQAGIQRALQCAALKGVPHDSAAKSGAITKAVWRAVMADAAVPSYRERADALILSFEATDFGDRPEWNFCQDSTRQAGGQFDPRAPEAVCYNESDPCSFLTWGPRGATAGQGREIQWVLWLAWTRAPADVERAFGREFAAVSRFVRLKGDPRNICTHGAPLERFMCAVWLDPARRTVWETAPVNSAACTWSETAMPASTPSMSSTAPSCRPMRICGNAWA